MVQGSPDNAAGCVHDGFSDGSAPSGHWPQRLKRTWFGQTSRATAVVPSARSRYSSPTAFGWTRSRGRPGAGALDSATTDAVLTTCQAIATEPTATIGCRLCLQARYAAEYPAPHRRRRFVALFQAFTSGEFDVDSDRELDVLLARRRHGVRRGRTGRDATQRTRSRARVPATTALPMSSRTAISTGWSLSVGARGRLRPAGGNEIW